jgi:hypothetical protein
MGVVVPTALSNQAAVGRFLREARPRA